MTVVDGVLPPPLEPGPVVESVGVDDVVDDEVDDEEDDDVDEEDDEEDDD